VTTEERLATLQPPVTRPRSPGAQVLTVRPWQSADGDPAFPRSVLGTPVRKQLLSRLDRPGGLVTLADGRYAFTGPILGVGPASALQDDARRRLAHASSDPERAWWRDVIGELAR
jgi:cell volume regulation protein A